MKATIYTLSSALHDSKRVENHAREFLQQIQQYTTIQLRMTDPVDEFWEAEGFKLLFVLTGGTEGQFAQHFASGVFGNQPIYIITSGVDNSLAASMEILSYLNGKGYCGEILHGSAQYIASRIETLSKLSAASDYLRGKTLGIVGDPSDWLISSGVDEQELFNQMGILLCRIPMQELLDAMPKEPSEDSVKKLKPCSSQYFNGALCIYEGLQALVEKYSLSGLTLRCFDLLTSVRNTGCLALALLNSEGIPAACEGDIPALVSMMVSQALFGVSGFQCNPSLINPTEGTAIFAHCTLPIDMVSDYSYDTHFESGIGVALHGILPEGPATLFKVSGDLKRYYAQDIEIIENQYDRNRCRTQILISAPGCDKYFFRNPIANHHLVVAGHHADEIKQLLANYSSFVK